MWYTKASGGYFSHMIKEYTPTCTSQLLTFGGILFTMKKNVYVISDVCDKVYSMQMDILVYKYIHEQIKYGSFMH